MGLLPLVKDFFEMMDNGRSALSGVRGPLTELSDYSSKYTELKDSQFFITVLGFLFVKIKSFVSCFFSFQWINSISYFPNLVPKMQSSLLNETFILEDPTLLTFLEIPTADSKGFNKLFLGFLNSFFLSLPVSTAHLFSVRRLLMYGMNAGVFSALGTIIGQLFFAVCVLFGLRSIIVTWYSLPYLSLLIVIIVSIVFYYELEAPIYTKKTNQQTREKFLKYFVMNFALSWTEQSTGFQYFRGLTFSPEPNPLETLVSTTEIDPVILTAYYVLGLCFGTFFFTGLFGFLIHRFWLYYYDYFYLKSFFMWLKEFHNFSKSVLFVSICLSFPLTSHGFDFYFSGPVGTVYQDPVMDGTLLSPGLLSNYSLSSAVQRNMGFANHTYSTNFQPFDSEKNFRPQFHSLAFEEHNLINETEPIHYWEFKVHRYVDRRWRKEHKQYLRYRGCTLGLYTVQKIRWTEKAFRKPRKPRQDTRNLLFYQAFHTTNEKSDDNNNDSSSKNFWDENESYGLYYKNDISEKRLKKDAQAKNRKGSLVTQTPTRRDRVAFGVITQVGPQRGHTIDSSWGIYADSHLPVGTAKNNNVPIKKKPLSKREKRRNSFLLPPRPTDITFYIFAINPQNQVPLPKGAKAQLIRIAFNGKARVKRVVDWLLVTTAKALRACLKRGYEVTQLAEDRLYRRRANRYRKRVEMDSDKVFYSTHGLPMAEWAFIGVNPKRIEISPPLPKYKLAKPFLHPQDFRFEPDEYTDDFKRYLASHVLVYGREASSPPTGLVDLVRKRVGVYVQISDDTVSVLVKLTKKQFKRIRFWWNVRKAQRACRGLDLCNEKGEPIGPIYARYTETEEKKSEGMFYTRYESIRLVHRERRTTISRVNKTVVEEIIEDRDKPGEKIFERKVMVLAEDERTERFLRFMTKCQLIVEEHSCRLLHKGAKSLSGVILNVDTVIGKVQRLPFRGLERRLKQSPELRAFLNLVREAGTYGVMKAIRKRTVNLDPYVGRSKEEMEALSVKNTLSAEYRDSPPPIAENLMNRIDLMDTNPYRQPKKKPNIKLPFYKKGPLFPKTESSQPNPNKNIVTREGTSIRLEDEDGVEEAPIYDETGKRLPNKREPTGRSAGFNRRLDEIKKPLKGPVPRDTLYNYKSNAFIEGNSLGEGLKKYQKVAVKELQRFNNKQKKTTSFKRAKRRLVAKVGGKHLQGGAGAGSKTIGKTTASPSFPFNGTGASHPNPGALALASHPREQLFLSYNYPKRVPTILKRFNDKNKNNCNETKVLRLTNDLGDLQKFSFAFYKRMSRDQRRRGETGLAALPPPIRRKMYNRRYKTQLPIRNSHRGFWLQSLGNKLLPRLAVNIFLQNQPKYQNLRVDEERTLFEKRLILGTYYETSRCYNQLLSLALFHKNGALSKGSSDKVFNHQFKGTNPIVRSNFAITERKRSYNRRWPVLKFDQPLYLPPENSSYKSLNFFHEELSREEIERGGIGRGGIGREGIDRKGIGREGIEREGNLLSQKKGYKNVFLELSNPIPFYAGWDQELKRVVVTNRLLPRSRAGYWLYSPKKDETFARFINLKENIRFTTWPIKRSVLPSTACRYRYTEYREKPCNVLAQPKWVTNNRHYFLENQDITCVAFQALRDDREKEDLAYLFDTEVLSFLPQDIKDISRAGKGWSNIGLIDKIRTAVDPWGWSFQLPKFSSFISHKKHNFVRQRGLALTPVHPTLDGLRKTIEKPVEYTPVVRVKRVLRALFDTMRERPTTLHFAREDYYYDMEEIPHTGAITIGEGREQTRSNVDVVDIHNRRKVRSNRFFYSMRDINKGTAEWPGIPSTVIRKLQRRFKSNDKNMVSDGGKPRYENVRGPLDRWR